MVHHIIKEDLLRDLCPYCKVDLSKKKNWNSEFDVNMHYKELVCKCGKKVWLKVDFLGSGHDSWAKQKKVTIENLVDKDDFRNQ